MTPKLRNLMVVVGLMTIGGTAYQLATRQPPETTMEELKDAGAVVDRFDRWVAVCPEKLSQKTVNYLKRNGYGAYNVGSIHRIARVIWEYQLTDGGRIALNPSLVVTLDGDAGYDDGGEDEDDGTDDSFQFSLDDCYRLECNAITDELRLLADAGFRHRKVDDTEQPWCNAATRRGRVTPPCVVPNCWTLADGGWNDSAVVDCLVPGRFGGQIWAGCNVYPAAGSTGTQCVPVECSTVAGDQIDVLR